MRLRASRIAFEQGIRREPDQILCQEVTVSGALQPLACLQPEPSSFFAIAAVVGDTAEPRRRLCLHLEASHLSGDAKATQELLFRVLVSAVVHEGHRDAKMSFRPQLAVVDLLGDCDGVPQILDGAPEVALEVEGDRCRDEGDLDLQRWISELGRQTPG